MGSRAPQWALPTPSLTGQRESASTGNSLRVTSENRTPSLHKGFLVPYQAVGESPPWGFREGSPCPQTRPRVSA